MMHITNQLCQGCPHTCATQSDCGDCSHRWRGYASYYPIYPVPEPKKDMTDVRKNWKAIQKEHGRRR